MKKIMLTMLSGSLVFGFLNANAGMAANTQDLPNVVAESNETNNIEKVEEDENFVNIKDENLLRCVNEALRKADVTSEVTTQEAQTLKALSCYNFQVNSKIVRLDGLEAFINLEILNLAWDRIVDINPLVGLTKLTRLELGGNRIEDIAPLAGLTKLTRLDLGWNLIEDITPLAGLTNLTTLYLHDNEIVDVAAIVPLKEKAANIYARRQRVSNTVSIDEWETNFVKGAENACVPLVVEENSELLEHSFGGCQQWTFLQAGEATFTWDYQEWFAGSFTQDAK